MNRVPGVSDLGWGFDIFGSYGDASLKSQLFDFSGGGPWEDPISGKSYLLPANVAVRTKDETNAFSSVFDTRLKVQEFFAVKAGLQGSYASQFGAFSGSFDSSYKVAGEREQSFKYAVYQADNVAWDLTLEAQSLAQLTPAVQQEFAALPDSFSVETRPAFFRFLQKYGTHYVYEVTVGGRLYYFVSVEKSYLKEDEKIDVAVTLEYNALLVSGKAQSSAEWSRLGEAWTEHREVHVKAIGGDPDSLLLAAPEYDDNRTPIYNGWVDSIKKNPATVDFKLRALSALLPSGQSGVLDEAIRAYLTENVLVVEARSTDSNTPGPLPVVILGSPIAPDVPPAHPYGFQAVILKPLESDFEVYLNRYYSIDHLALEDGYTPIFDQMLADLEEYSEPGYLLVLASFNWYWQAPPTHAFYSFLRSAGGGALLEAWLDGVSSPGSINHQDSTYVLVGATASGPGQGVEGLDKAPLFGGDVTTTVAVRLNGLSIQRLGVPPGLALESAPQPLAATR